MTGDPPSPAEEDENEAASSFVSVHMNSVAMGKAMVEFRRRRAMTQRAVAARGRISENHLGKLERGEVPDPGLQSIVKVARALETSVVPLVLAFAERPLLPMRRIEWWAESRAVTLAPSAALGATLRVLRRKIDLSQAVLAKEAGLAPPTVSRLEAGKKKDPALSTLVRIAGALARVDGSVRADDALSQLAATFAHEIQVPKEAMPWLRRRRHAVLEDQDTTYRWQDLTD